MDETPPVRLLARDAEDLTVISAMVQDALVPAADLAYLAAEKSFVMALNRFRWEEGADRPGPGGDRVHAGLRFDRVERVRFRGIDRRDGDRLLALLALNYEPGVLTIEFSDDVAIRLEVETLVCALHDLDESWPTLWRPAPD